MRVSQVSHSTTKSLIFGNGMEKNRKLKTSDSTEEDTMEKDKKEEYTNNKSRNSGCNYIYSCSKRHNVSNQIEGRKVRPIDSILRKISLRPPQ